MAESTRADALKAIERNIKRSGFHVYFVEQHSTPRFLYTIGLSERIGAELVLAGAIYYFGDDALKIVHSIREQLDPNKKQGDAPPDFEATFALKKLGSFRLQKAHPSWSSALLLGAFDYYGGKAIDTYQIVPDEEHSTVDVPDMRRDWSAADEPAWRWIHEAWPYSFPESSTATTNLAALRGDRVTEVGRWEEDEWEMFAGPGPEVTKKEMRVVPVACLVGADPSLAVALDLEVGKALWRDAEGGAWNAWEKSDEDQ